MTQNPEFDIGCVVTAQNSRLLLLSSASTIVYISSCSAISNATIAEFSAGADSIDDDTAVPAVFLRWTILISIVTNNDLFMHFANIPTQQQHK